MFHIIMSLIFVWLIILYLFVQQSLDLNRTASRREKCYITLNGTSLVSYFMLYVCFIMLYVLCACWVQPEIAKIFFTFFFILYVLRLLAFQRLYCIRIKITGNKRHRETVVQLGAEWNTKEPDGWIKRGMNEKNWTVLLILIG